MAILSPEFLTVKRIIRDMLTPEHRRQLAIWLWDLAGMPAETVGTKPVWAAAVHADTAPDTAARRFRCSAHARDRLTPCDIDAAIKFRNAAGGELYSPCQSHAGGFTRWVEL